MRAHVTPLSILLVVAGELSLSGCNLGFDFSDSFRAEPPKDNYFSLAAPSVVRAVQGYPDTVHVYAYATGTRIDSLVADYSALPAGRGQQFMVRNEANQVHGQLIWAPTQSDSGSCTVTFTARSEGRSKADTTTIYITNHLIDSAPVVMAPTETTVVLGDTLRVHVFAADPDGDPIFSWMVAPNLASYGIPFFFFEVQPPGDEAILTWRPGGQPGTITFTFWARSFVDGSASTVVNVVAAPSVLRQGVPNRR